VRDFYALRVGPHKRFRQAISRFFAVHKLSTVQRKLSPCKPGFSTGNPQIEPGWRWLQPFPPGRKHEIGHAGRGSVGEAGDQPDGAQGLGSTQGGWPVNQQISRAVRTSSAKPQSSADLAGDRPGTRGPGRMGRSGRGRTTGRTARGDAAEATWPDKGRGPSTHEMEGPIRSSSAGHRYLMLSVRTTRSTTKPDTRLKSQLPSSPCAPGCPPDGSVFGSERFLRLSRAGAQEVSASNFKIFWLSTNCPQLSPSYPPVDPLSPHEIHRRAAYPVPGALFGGPTERLRRRPV